MAASCSENRAVVFDDGERKFTLTTDLDMRKGKMVISNFQGQSTEYGMTEREMAMFRCLYWALLRAERN